MMQHMILKRFWLAWVAGLLVVIAGCGQSSEAPGEDQIGSVNQGQSVQGDIRPRGKTQYGPVTGSVDDGILVFKGVRYGADTAASRFQPPVPPNSWDQAQDALHYGPACPQNQRSYADLGFTLFNSWATEPDPGVAEDCLFLNVWTPALDGAARPVMVWLHGGGFTTGSGSSNAYDGVRLANRGNVVVVTVNHRLNIFGYTYLDNHGSDFAGSGNVGMLDLVAALQWVQENIAGFGGDPDNVLIFGESGGGWKVSTLMAMDAARGLFHKAVAQSGPGLTLMEADTAAAQSDALIEELGLTSETVEKIRTLPMGSLLEAASRLAADNQSVGSRPVVDGVYQHRHPFTPVAPEQSKTVPLMIGSTRTEMSLLAGIRQPALFHLTWDTLPGALSQGIPGVDAAAVIAGYRALHPDIDAPNLYFEATTDHGVFGRGSFELADRKADQGGAPVYQYYLTWRTPVENGKWGATHALDIGFVFDNVAKSESMSGVGDEQQALADVMSEAWLAFARTGNPNHENLPEWPEYTRVERATMIFDNTSYVASDPRGRERAVIDAALAD